ncbi:tRNA (guanosine(37)-N1)-methyltransferase TrmD [Candidatus Woesebacteria bacterium]|nr:tRNA (guanosine(37)-N1)-methyltransferase TrmD [Candidatus Woesebacteria bacterium]MBP9687152.1 tRNA (guanosine(37)-N1)-methyltransferase TrmD [Candidatus Woesebacteria bacterium]
MKIDILTLFPEMFKGPFDDSLMARAQKQKLVTIKTHDLRQFGLSWRKTIDDRPYGGGVGMIMMVEPIEKAIKKLSRRTFFSFNKKKPVVVLLTPRGEKFTQAKAQELSKVDHLILICGRYEGFDERIHEHLVDMELSVGDYVMMGGEIPAMVVTETVTRLIPGVIVKEDATKYESFSDPSLLEAPQYTRPEKYKDWTVPKVLLSGDPKKINEWKTVEALKKTKQNRPDLVK